MKLSSVLIVSKSSKYLKAFIEFGSKLESLSSLMMKFFSKSLIFASFRTSLASDSSADSSLGLSAAYSASTKASYEADSN